MASNKEASLQPAASPSEKECDQELVRQLLLGDERVFLSLVNRLHASLVRLATVYVGNRATAEEIAQDTWMALITGLSGFAGRSSLKTWIFRILTNKAKTRAIRDGRSIPFSSLGDLASAPEPTVDPHRFDKHGMWSTPPAKISHDNPESVLLRQELLNRIEAVIDSLPPAQRAVVILHDVDGLDSAEVCNILDISGTNQRVLLHRARAKLRQMLETSRVGG